VNRPDKCLRTLSRAAHSLAWLPMTVHAQCHDIATTIPPLEVVTHSPRSASPPLSIITVVKDAANATPARFRPQPPSTVL
jgi:hypothetical protein